ncbi:MAG: class II aldolase/adducin family protein [Eubacteriales bacterium]|nr:class II aldolase/adducin family protein [Eubacteriales bacterium]
MVIQGVTYPSDFEAKKAIIAAAAKLEARGFQVAGDGSLSVRVGPNAIWITVEGADKAALQQDQLVRIDLSGKQMATNKPRPLGEDLPIHLRIYRENETVQGIVHAYPVCAAVLGQQGVGMEAAAFSPSVRRMGRIQLLPQKDAQTQAEAVGLLCRTDRGVLLQNDGCMAWGKSLSEAVQTVEAMDYYCKVKKCTGGPKSCTCGHSRTGLCDGSCKAPAPQSVCDGKCAVCASASVCPSRAPVPAAPQRPAAGMTGIIRPGEGLPTLPPLDTAPPTPAAVPVSPAPVPAPAQVLAVDVPKADVMAEVVRRAMGK